MFDELHGAIAENDIHATRMIASGCAVRGYIGGVATVPFFEVGGHGVAVVAGLWQVTIVLLATIANSGAWECQAGSGGCIKGPGERGDDLDIEKALDRNFSGRVCYGNRTNCLGIESRVAGAIGD